MKRTLLRLAVGWAVFMFTTSGAFAISPADTVRKSNAADRTVSYRGTKITTMYVGRRIQARMQVVHQKPDKTRIEYTSPREIDGIITIDKGYNSWRFLPNKGVWEHQKWNLGEESLALALKNYNVKSAGSGSVAGRDTYIIKLVPKYHGIPSETLWVDKKTYLVLKSEVRGPSGSVRSSSSFDSIQYNPPIGSGMFDVRGSVKDEPRSGAFGFDPIKPDYMPRGYVLVGISPVKVQGGTAAHLQYTNGINTISIFERKLSSSSNASEKSEKKPNGITIITSSKGHLSFTVIGDIDSHDLLKIAKSLK